MIPVIGIMLALYIATRCLDMFTSETSDPAVRAFSLLTIFASFVGIILLVLQARELDQVMRAISF